MSASGTGSRRDALAAAVVAGAAGGLAVSGLEAALGQGGSFAGALALAAGLLLSLGACVEVCLAAVGCLLPAGNRPMDWLRRGRSARDPAMTAAVLGAGLWGLALLLAGYRLFHFFLTGFHHTGLKALALALSAAVFAAVAYLLIGRTIAAFQAASTRLGEDRPWVARPAIAAACVAILWAAAVVPPLLDGPDAGGPFGFLGLLRKDGLGAGPVLALGLVCLIAGLGMGPVRALGRRRSGAAALVALALSAAGLPAAEAVASRSPSAVERLVSAGGLGKAVVAAIRRASDLDRDGYGRFLGGRDCDDRNAAVHPGARDVPGNGVDEDCSGDDLRRRPATSPRLDGGSSPVPDRALRRPALPADVSLLLITVDSFRYDAPGFMGNPRPLTPSLDALAARGAVYERAYALGSYTAQAIPSLLTGKYACELRRNDQHETRYAPEETFAAELVCDETVRCAAFLPHFLFAPGFRWNQGFPVWTIVDAEPAGPGYIDSKHNSHLVTDAALLWLGDPANTAGRFWLWVHYMDPHKEYVDHPGFEKLGDSRRDRYDHEVLFTDHHIGRLLDAFAAMPAAARTVIIVTGDHGEAFFEHGRWTHGAELWEEIIRVPLAVAGPGVAEKRIARPTSLVDLFPTVLDLFGAKPPGGTHGRSLLADWVDGQELPAVPIVADQPRNPYYEGRRVFISNGWKLHHLQDSFSFRLYKLTGDVEQGESLVAKEPAAFARIKAEYERFLADDLAPVDPVPDE